MHDKELEQLRQRTRDILGEEAYSGALRRSKDVALRQGQHGDPDSRARAESAALKIELRRLLTPH
jgi:hypothetical protein